MGCGGGEAGVRAEGAGINLIFPLNGPAKLQLDSRACLSLPNLVVLHACRNSRAPEGQKTHELTVNVTADGDGALDGLDVGLVDEDFPCLRFV